MKKAQLKTIFMIMLFAIIGIASVLALFSVETHRPSSEWVLTSSVSFNFTPNSTVATLPWCAVYSNKSDIWNVTANYSNVPNGTPYVRGIAFGDSATITSYHWNVVCYNGSDEINYTSKKSFGVDSNVPSVTLDSPAAGVYLKINNTNFTYTPTDPSNLEACDFYHNMTGTWHINETNSSVNSGKVDLIENATGVDQVSGVPDGRYSWNVWCNDSAGNSAWSGNNRTFIVDITDPTDIKITLPANNTVSANSTPHLSWNYTTDTNFEKYVVNVATYSNMTNIIQTEEITNRTGNSTTLSNLGTDRTYYINVTAYDLADNIASVATVLFYTLDRETLNVTLNTPSNGSYLNDDTPDFNVTVLDDNPDACVLYLTNSTTDITSSNDSLATSLAINQTVLGVTNNTVMNLTPTMADGTYKYNVGCNDSTGTNVNVSSRLYVVTIDTSAPTAPHLTMPWGLTNNTDNTPELSWVNSTETNFERFLAQAFYTTNGTIAYGVNVTTQSTKVAMNLTDDYSYNFSVTAYDLAGNSNISANTTESWYYVDPVCGTLASGWNLCGAVWTTPRSLTQIGGETSATFVTVWNMSNHVWATCNYAVSATGVNCGLNVSIDSYYKTLIAPTIVTNLSVNVSGASLAADTYFYKVTAISKAGGESMPSSEGNVTTDGNGNASMISWTAVIGADSYRVYNGTDTGNLTSYFETGNVSFNHSGQAPIGVTNPANTSYYILENSPTVWVYVNTSTEWRNRTWVAKAGSANITLTNISNRWNIIAGFFRNGRTFGHLGRSFEQANVTMFSLPYSNGTTVPYVNIGNGTGFVTLKNNTLLDYGRAMWVYYNGTGQTNFTWDVGSW